jgi:general secretion pathway protein G
MSARKRRNAGFTLIEILIVVVILGILAAIVIPQFTTASDAARASSLVSQLQTIRSQLELYNVQHGGGYPDLADVDGNGTMWDRMLQETDAAGAIAVGNPFGPYLQKAPKNPFTTSSSVGVLGAAVATDGWAYDIATGEFRAVLPNTFDPVELGIDAVDIEVP